MLASCELAGPGMTFFDIGLNIGLYPQRVPTVPLQSRRLRAVARNSRGIAQDRPEEPAVGSVYLAVTTLADFVASSGLAS